MIIAWVLNVAWTGLAFDMLSHGFGVLHMWDLSLARLFTLLRVRTTNHSLPVFDLHVEM